MSKYVKYCRVSTTKQGDSGLGLEAQSEAINVWLHDNDKEAEVIASYEEVHSGTDLDGCAKLQESIEICIKEGAILIIAKYDRLRDLRGVLDIIDRIGADHLICCNAPSITDPLCRNILFTLAEEEARWISIRTRAALAIRKKQIAEEGKFQSSRTGYTYTRLGNPRYKETIKEFQEAGVDRNREIFRADAKRRAAYMLALRLREGHETIGHIVETLNAMGEPMRPDSIKSWNYENYGRMMRGMEGVELEMK